jgi:hypothetical protein
VHDIAGDLVADVADKGSDRESRDRVAPGLAKRDGDQPDKGTGRGQGIQPGMLASASRVAEPMRLPIESL